MLYYVIRNRNGQFYNSEFHLFFGWLGDATLWSREEHAIARAARLREERPDWKVKVSAFSVEFSDV